VKKVVLSVIVSVFGLAAIPMSSAFAAPLQPTQIDGQITLSDGTTPVVGANVYAVCDGNTSSTVSSVTGGLYKITMPVSKCATGDTATVYAEKGKLTGSDSNSVAPGRKFDFTVVNVSVSLPEMGAVTGSLAALAAGGAFLVIRRKQVGQQ
jgi:hypothetical protein